MQRMIMLWSAACITFTTSCGRDCTPQAVSPPSYVAPVQANKPLTGSNSAELPASSTSALGAGQAQEIASPTVPPPSTKPEPLSDAQIVGITQTANSSEVDQGRIAQTKATRRDTKQFAAMMIRQHEEAQNEQARLGIPIADSPVCDQLRSDASSTIQKLRSASGNDFDRVYIDARVDTQRKLLALVESQLQPDAKDIKLKGYLERIKSKLQMQLQKAEMQQQALSSNSQPGFVETEAKPPPSASAASR